MCTDLDLHLLLLRMQLTQTHDSVYIYDRLCFSSNGKAARSRSIARVFGCVVVVELTGIKCGGPAAGAYWTVVLCNARDEWMTLICKISRAKFTR
jgi:hypothetical protein